MPSPDENLNKLFEIIKELSLGISPQDVQRVLDVPSPEELTQYVQMSVESALKSKLEHTWRKFKIPEKLEKLHELESKIPNEEAWRPVTGEVDLNAILAQGLTNRKVQLEKKLDALLEHKRNINNEIEELLSKIDQEVLELTRLN